MRRHIDRHLNQVKAKPEHVRHRIAIGTSAAVTGLVAVFWLVGHATSGTFALSDSPGTRVTEEVAAEFGDSKTQLSDLMGAVGNSFGATSTDPELTIVDGQTSSTITPPPQGQPSDATVIPF